MNWVEATERLGGWAVVVWIVWWLTKRWEHQMTEMCNSIKELASTMKDEFNKFYEEQNVGRHK